MTLHAAIVVNAAGAWAEEIGILADATDIGLRPLRRTACQQPVEKPPHKRNALNQANDEVHIIKPPDSDVTLRIF